MDKQRLLSELSDEPVLGVAMGRVSVLRLDLLGGLAPGNKSFKLQENLERARRKGLVRLVSFGGSWSNHLHALAAVGREQGFETVGIVRGEQHDRDTAMLADARRWGMRLVHVSRQEYRRRNDRDYLDALERELGPCLVIPEGGANDAGARGCMAVGSLLAQLLPGGATVFLGVGTGTTLAGVVAGLPDDYGRVFGVSALKGALDLESRIRQGLQACGAAGGHGCWRVLHDHHCGGFARCSPELREFMQAFQRVHGIPLEPVYTGKALFAVHNLLVAGQLDASEDLVLVHTGGLQGARGFAWLSSPDDSRDR
jgi:1-aminocyclopropane-1-carboxylate deaminase